MRTRALILSVLLVLVAAVTTAAAPVPVPESDPSRMLFVGQARLKGETAALGKLLMGPSPVRYRFIFVEEIGDEDREAYLAPELITAADKTLAEMAASGGRADPSLCTQNLPLTLTVSAAEETGPTQSQVLVRKGWGEGRETTLTVRLAQREGRWQITRISCSAP